MSQLKDRTLIFLGDNLYPYKTGGYEVFNYYFLTTLRDRYKIQVISHHKRPDYLSHTEYLRIPTVRPEGFFHPFFYFGRLCLSHGKKNTMVVLTFARSRWFYWWPYPLLKKVFGLKYIIIIHGGGLTEWKWKYPFRKLFINASKVVGISRRICEEYEQRTGVELEFIPPLIPFVKYEGAFGKAREKWKFKLDKFICLSVGSLKGLKNPDTIVNAAIKLGANFLSKNRLLFVFAGNGPMKAELEKIVDSEGLSEYFVFLGNVNRDNISSLYSAANTYIIGSDYEGTPLSLLEAMYNGLPILASDAPGINSLIQHGKNGYLFETKNFEMLADLLIKIVSDRDFVRLGVSAREIYFQQYSYEKMLNEYCQIIDSI